MYPLYLSKVGTSLLLCLSFITCRCFVIRSSNKRIGHVHLLSSWPSTKLHSLFTHSTPSSSQHHRSWSGSLFDPANVPKWGDEEHNAFYSTWLSSLAWHVEAVGICMQSFNKNGQQPWIKKRVSRLYQPNMSVAFKAGTSGIHVSWSIVFSTITKGGLAVTLYTHLLSRKWILLAF
jgi:hypothetical protein